MRELYAIDPEILRTPQDLAHLRDMFGFQAGRFIAEYPNGENTNWLALVLKGLEDCGELERKRCISHLEKICKGLIPLPAKYQKHLHWVQNARTELVRKKQVTSLAKILTSPDVMPHNSYEPLMALVDFADQHDPHDARAGVIQNTVDEYCALVEPLFAVSTEVILIDRYLHFTTKDDARNNTELLLALCRLAGPSKRCQKITIVAGIQNSRDAKFSPANAKGELEVGFGKAQGQIVKILGAARPQLEYFVIDDMEVLGTEMHARFCCSAKGAIQFDHGYKISKSGKNLFQWGNEEIAKHVEWKIQDLRNSY